MPTNIDKLHVFYFISELKSYPDVVVITETKLKQDKNYVSINLDSYNLMHIDSKTNAGGVGIYIQDSIEYEIVKQIKLDFKDTENLWVKLEINNKRFIILGAAYRHPVQLVENLIQFSHSIIEIYHELNSQNIEQAYYVLGDFSIDLF